MLRSITRYSGTPALGAYVAGAAWAVLAQGLVLPLSTPILAGLVSLAVDVQDARIRTLVAGLLALWNVPASTAVRRNHRGRASGRPGPDRELAQDRRAAA